MISSAVQAFFYIFFPAVILRYGDRLTLLKWAGPIVLSYAVGLLIGNLPFVPVDTALSNLMVSATVPLAIMLLVLPADIVHWLNHAGSAILSYLCCIVAVTFSAVAGFYLFRNYTPEAAD
ncbi:MAG: DUF819 family protein, partial [Balneolaceae bacterium]|nr:DUF819 family protein [Balneolaceae bacterium]